MKKTLLISSLIIIAVLLAEAYRENLNMDWQWFQKDYKVLLKNLAKTEQEVKVAENFEIKMRQIVMPELNRVDRCVICHVGIEDSRMMDQPNPLKTHPGDYLETHDVDQVGCTMCHDGQGRAITFNDAIAHGHDKFWEKPALLSPFVEANCYRCHHGGLKETPTYNAGKELFEASGCLGCHQVNGKGGVSGPDLSDLGNASFHVKMPTPENREHLLHEFSDNVNLAYIYEAVKDPHAQPENSAMVDYHFTNEDAVKLTVFLKSLTVGSVPKNLVAESTEEFLTAPVERGAKLYGMYCSACHGPKGEGTHLNELGKIGPAIGNTEFLSIANKDLIKHVISFARGGEMPAFKTTGGLAEKEIDDIVEYIQSFTKTPPSFEEVRAIEGNPKFGEVVFTTNCSSCHGSGSGFDIDLIGPTLNNSTLLGFASEQFWYDVITKGRPGTAMPAWHFLSDYQLADLIAYLENLKPARLDQEKVLSALANSPSLENGEKLYRGNCSTCHGPEGKGGLAPSLNNPEFQKISDAKFLLKVLTHGRQGTAMPSWNHISEENTADLIAYIKSWQVGDSVMLSNERIVGSEREGEMLFKESCQKCHLVGRGSVVAPAIFSKGFLSQVSDQYIKQTIMYGRGSTAMPPVLVGESGVVEYSEEQINSLVAYLRSFESNPIDLRGMRMFYGDEKQGEELYQRSCAQCHGDHAEGGIGPAIGKKGFLDSVSDGFIYAMMRMGRPGSEMKSFPTHGDGFSNLKDEEAMDIISFLRNNVNVAEKHDKQVRGYVERGKELYARNCAQCHGDGGSGGIAPSLGNKNFLDSVSDSYLQATMSLGRHGTQMRPMMKGGGGVVELSSEEVNDIIAFLRSLIPM